MVTIMNGGGEGGVGATGGEHAQLSGPWGGDATGKAAEANGAAFVATSDWLCGETTCPVVLGDLLMYRDDNHITATASQYLTPFVEAAIAPLLRS